MQNLIETLTATERKVLPLMAGGLPDAMIAQLMGRASDTARHHVGQIRAKLSAVNRTHAAAIAIFYKDQLTVQEKGCLDCIIYVLCHNLSPSACMPEEPLDDDEPCV